MTPASRPETPGNKTGRIQISPSAAVTRTGSGVILRSELGTFQVSGPDVGAFLERIVPLLDGTRDEEALFEALSDYARPSVEAFLRLLEERGLLEPAAPSPSRWRGPEAFLRPWVASPSEATTRLEAARVLVVGLEPWGAAAAIELAAAGVGALHLIDGGPSGGRTAAWREALAVRIGQEAPWCRVEASPLGALDGKALLEGGEWGLLVAAIDAGDAGLLERVARFAHRAGIVSLWSHLAGTTAVLGPLVTPGVTACRICATLEGLNPPLPAGSGLDVASSGAANQLLGHLAAMEALREITEYTTSTIGGRVLVEDLATFETSIRALVRSPWCRVCGERATTER